MTHTCSCSSRVEPKLGLFPKGNQLAEESCKNCGGKLKFDEIVPVPARIPVLEVMNSMSPDLKWQTVTKKRRSKMSIARSSNCASNAAHSGSNFNKFDEAIADNAENVPIKKRRHKQLISPSPNAFNNGVLYKQTEGENSFTWDFSGMELLATAAAAAAAATASLDDDKPDNANKEDIIVPEDSPVPESSDPSKLGLKCIGSEDPKNNESLNAAETKKISAPFKVDRMHWDLNTVMDDWDEPYDDPTAGNSSKNVTDEDVHVEVGHEGSSLEFSNLKTEENKLKEVSPDGIRYKLPSLEDGSRESENNYSFSVAAKETSDQANERVITSNTVVETPNQFVNIDTKDSPKTSELSRGAICKSLDVVSSNSDEVKSLSSTSKTGSFLALSGTPIEDDQSVRNDDSKNRDEDVALTDFSVQLEPDELVVHPEHITLSNEESQRIIIMENSCKSCSSGAQCHNRTDSTIDARHDDSDIFQDQNGQIDAYDSPSEDGELRGSFLYSWEDNECIDYESDGRNGKGSDDADFITGFEGSHGREMTILGKGDKRDAVKRSLKRRFVKHDSDDNGLDGKNESNAGSGTTVEQSMETVMEETDHELKQHFSDRSDAVNGKVAHTVEDLSRTLSGKVCIEKRSNLDGSDGKNDLFVQQYRSHHFGGSYSRPERDLDHEKYPVQYRPSSTHASKRGGIDQWKHWSSRKPYTSNYQGPTDAPIYTRPRNISGDSPDKFNCPGFRDHKPTAHYASKSFHRPPFRRSPPPVDREDSFGVQRTSLTLRGRGRGRFSRTSGRDFGEDFEPMRRDFAAHLPKREISSPRPSRGADHTPLIRRKSRSRSRTRSPVARNSQKEPNFGGTRWNNRYREFKPEGRMRGAFSSKPNFGSDYERGYTSPPPPRRRRFSPEINGDRNFPDRRSPPVRDFRRTQKFDGVGSLGRSNPDEYFRPVIRPRKMDGDDKFETGYEDKRRGENMINQGRRAADDGGNLRGGRKDKRV